MNLTIEEFLERYVAGYLLSDLRAMLAVPAPEPGKYGACGFSIVLVTLAGVELMGFLTSDQDFNPNYGRQYFRQFWSEFLYPEDQDRIAAAGSIYNLVRHGLAHTFLTKPGIIVSTQRHGTKNHLSRLADGSLQIDACALADDFMRAFKDRVMPMLSVLARRDAMQGQLERFQRAYTTDSERLSQAFERLPSAEPEPWIYVPSGEVSADNTLINSPTVPPSSSGLAGFISTSLRIEDED